MLIIWTEITEHCSVVVSISVTLKDKMFINPFKIIDYDKLISIPCKDKWICVYTSNSINDCLSAF